VRSGLYSRLLKGFRKERSTVREDQSLAQMANEVLMRQAKVRADQSGEPIEEAMEAVVNTEAGKQLSRTSEMAPTAMRASNRRR
jgi:hypothetical protein